MIRRRRPEREIAFSFDSFLDVVANVVGIIIRLILVVWVGARSYTSLQNAPPPAAPAAATAEPALPEDPLQRELAEHRRQLEEAQARLLAQLRQLQHARESETQVEGELANLSARLEKVRQEHAALEQTAGEASKVAQTAALTSEELRQRGRRLADEIQTLEKLPPPKQTLRYRTPVSRPVQAEELLFECQHGRVSFIDIAALLAEVHRNTEEKADRLRSQWELRDTAGPVGPFRLQYVIERERGALDTLAGDGSPDAHVTFHYGLSSWQVEPVSLQRGEAAEAALAPGSEFRQVVDAIDPHQTVATFWVYPDSFALYRRLRDYLYEHDVVVAGRPLPQGVPISCSRRGTASRGQ